MKRLIIFAFFLVFFISFISAALYVPASCSNSEIRKTWNSIFIESSDDTTIFTSGNSSNGCSAYFAYKVKGSELYYLVPLDLSMFNLSLIGGVKLDANQSFITLLNNIHNISEASNLIYSINIFDDVKLRNKPLNYSNLSLEFNSIFKETSGNWTKVEPSTSSEIAYEFIKNDTSGLSATAGYISLKRNYSAISYAYMINSSKSTQTVKEKVNASLTQKQENLNKIKSQIGNFSTFYQNSLKETIDLANLDKQMIAVKRDYAAASSDRDYLAVLDSLDEIKMPSSVDTTEKADSLLFFPKRDNIDLSVLGTIGGGSYDVDRESEYIEAVLTWEMQNFETKINFKQISIAQEKYTIPILSVFELNFNEKKSLSNQPYLIMKNVENLKFGKDYGQLEESGYYYIQLAPNQEKITFSTTENINFVDLPAFVAPQISKLGLQEKPIIEENTGISKWVFYIIFILFILCLAVVVYILLHRWYKNKYEDHLFKNRNNLYNLLSYIHASKIKGTPDQEIKNKLKKTGWNSEQITYAINKYAGKSIGMFGYSKRVRNIQKNVPVRPGFPGKNPFQNRRPGY